MNEEYPLYPILSEEGKQEAQVAIDGFKKRIKMAAEEAISEVYTNIADYIESDAWSNFRQSLLNGLCDYRNRLRQGDYDFAKIRRTIFEKYRDEIIADLNQDLVKENEELKIRVKNLEAKDDRNRAWGNTCQPNSR